MPSEQVESFGQEAPRKRFGQPAELAPVYVLQASGDSSYIGVAHRRRGRHAGDLSGAVR